MTYLFFSRKQVAASQADAERDGVVVPTTMEEYCMKAKPPQSPQVSPRTFLDRFSWPVAVLKSLRSQILYSKDLILTKTVIKCSKIFKTVGPLCETGFEIHF